MKMPFVLPLCFYFFVGVPLASGELRGLVERELEVLERTYQYLHANPELSYFEKETSKFLADALEVIGFKVTSQVGTYRDAGRVSYGVVGVLENGDGPTVLVRTDMDALPVLEQTGLPYASKIRIRTENGVESGVMHACGHDVHMTCFLGTARLMEQLKERWRGTLVLVAQPAEERGSGAKALLEDGLYERFPRPDFVLALHASPSLTAGTVGYRPGYALASVDSVNIKVRGRGGHGAYPHATKDPVVLAAQIILALQTITSRIISPLDPAVVTVGSIHGGTKHNIIPNEVRLQLTIRSYKPEVRREILESIGRICLQTARAAGIPDELLPIVSREETEFTPATYNDPELTESVVTAFTEELGAEQVIMVDPVMAGEDFSRYSLDDHQISSMIFWLGTVDPARVEARKSAGAVMPPLHSSEFAPEPRLTLETGIRAMTGAVLSLMKVED